MTGIAGGSAARGRGHRGLAEHMSLQVKFALLLLFLLDSLLAVFFFLLPHWTLANRNSLWTVWGMFAS